MIALILVVVTLGVFLIVLGLFDATSAAQIDNNAHNPAPTNVSDIEGTSDSGDEHEIVREDTASPDTSPPLIISDYTIVRLREPDISRGNLILINNDHFFESPDVIYLVNIAEKNTSSYRVSRDEILLAASIVEPLNAMMDAFYAVTGSNSVSVISGYRSHARQREVLDDHIARMGEPEARRWAALPGHSEHHSGLAVDFGFYSYGVLRTFLGTGPTAWFSQNSHNFGFILRYPENKTAITQTAHEPWHFRYVGNPHATIMHQNSWVLEEYIEHLMNYSVDEPFIVMLENGTYKIYEIYFSADLEKQIPHVGGISISGNNINGFIVTIRRYA